MNNMTCGTGVELPFLIRPENTARYEDGEVLILALPMTGYVSKEKGNNKQQ
jgi:hypothetical protein